MSFLHSRSRSASASRPQTPASASAHKAATQAFLASRASQANLSASAAAQALRTMSPPPVPVDQVQTKRMIQRQASPGSLSNSARGRGRGGLQRQNSSGSMTERTFRTPSPSPSRPVSRSGPQPPPLPTIPQQFASASPTPVKKKKRASSQDAPPPRVLSPPLTGPSYRGQSLDRYGSPQPLPPQSSVQRDNHTPPNNDLERIDSRNSVNFSRPLSPRPQSPTPQSPVLTNGDRSNGSGYVNPIVSAIPPAQAARIQHDLTQTSNQPVKKKKKKKVAPGAVEGSHLQSGTMASKPVVTPYESTPEPQPQALPEEQPATRKKKKKEAPLVEEVQGPIPENIRSDSDSDSNVERKKDKRAQRASGILQKQPSVVREDWEGEQEDQVTPPQVRQMVDNLGQEKRPINTANVSRKIEEPVTSPTTTKQPQSSDLQATTVSSGLEDSPASMNYLQVTEPQNTRGTSLSPSRSTRFSDRLSSDLAAGRKHEPLPRSVSPAKPALKHYSAGIDGHARGSSVTPSEASDVSSASVEGPPKRKKSVRVSFDAQPEIVNPVPNEQSPVTSPGKERKSWLGLGKSKPPLNTIPSNGDMEELMKPRPQLPSFGSVRGQKFKDSNDTNVTQPTRSPPDARSAPAEARIPTQSATSSEASSTYTPHTAAGISSDHAVGAILAQEAQRATKPSPQSRFNEPLPPEVRSVEGVLSYSDDESDASEVVGATNITPSPVSPESQIRTPQTAVPVQSVNQQVTAIAQPVEPARPAEPTHPEIPVLSVSPPTPAAEQRPFDQYLVVVPGGFPVSAESLARLDESNKGQQGRNADTDDDETDNDSIYSDAAEDPSEMEGLGFGSIDAILESPVAPPPTRVTSPPESPLAHVSAPPQIPMRTASWDQTQAHWSGIAQQTRQMPAQQPEPPVLESVPDVEPTSQTTSRQLAEDVEVPAYRQPSQSAQVPQPPPSQPPQPDVSQPTRKKKSPATIAALASAQTPPDSPPRRKNQPSAFPPVDTPSPSHVAAAAAPFRQSMRASSPPEVDPGFRKSMRNENRRSAPAPARSAPQQQPAPPPTSAAPRQRPAPSQPRGALQKKNIPLATAAAVNAPLPRAKPAPQPVTNDSDSESSFRKARRSKSTTGGKYSMRRSMRGAPEPTLRGEARNGARSVSPVGRRPFSPPDTSRSMRTTMRGSMDNTPTLRGSSDARRSASLLSRPQKSTPAPTSGFTQRNRSRILDSDDEDEVPRPSKFRSRFADDSDDDVDVPQFAPVRGIPRRHNDEDSTDLDDSSDEERPAPAVKTPPKLQIPQNNTSVPNSSAEALSPNSEKKRGLFGMFRSKKPKDQGLTPVIESPQAKLTERNTDTSKPSRLGFSSNAERDRMIEQTRAKLEASKSQQHPGGQQQGHNKLQRRQMPERVMSDSWPLPPTLADEKPQRPTTSDGPPMRNGTTRLNQGSMRKPNAGVDTVGRSGKKKKFPKLRKAFGLTD
ncbi:hypothetical protein H2200_011496 [Cladophialophora chaetospira]|uniref:Uncharacterized protein n=1 Tax=Cladophialophora chaetospira TaxID=386627 RepID=A0AA38WZE9_9EURO|nr:hypothetical protein H2200_011496 [Cladophialophora chaetospira]